MLLPTISFEQENVVNKLINNNVFVDSVAGSGKTTCSLYIAKQFFDLKILLLTYNAKLKMETKIKVCNYNINNIEVFSYHSFCVKNYHTKCFTDKEINLILLENNISMHIIDYDIIILDEAQDISILYYELFCKIYNDNIKKAKLCIFGDIKQSIFNFNNADERYIKYANILFNFNNLLWEECKLSKSFRITNEIALFINKCLLNDDRLISDKITYNKPRYIICDIFIKDSENNRLLNEIKYYLCKGYKSDEIFILAPSISPTKNSPIRLLENKIKNELPQVQIYAPSNDEEKPDEDVLKNKLVFLTFHQSKGLERKVILIINFDNSYFKYYNVYKNVNYCPNELYVATTRAIEHLTVFHHFKHDYLDFIVKDNLELYCNIEYNNLILTNSTNKLNVPVPIVATKLIKHIPYNIIDICIDMIEIKHIYYSNKIIKIDSKTKQPDSCEIINDITGIAIPCYFELKIKGEISILNVLKKNKNYNKLNNVEINNILPKDLLYLANCWHHYLNGFLFKLYQIKYYNWLTLDNLLKCTDRMLSLLKISKNAIFEKKYEVTINKVDINGNIYNIIGNID